MNTNGHDSICKLLGCIVNTNWGLGLGTKILTLTPTSIKRQIEGSRSFVKVLRVHFRLQIVQF